MTNGASGPYSPQSVTVVVGVNNTIKWTNNDPARDDHTVTSNTNGLFNSGDMGPGQTFICTFTAPGTYYYHCTYHPLMVGTVIVKAAP